MINIRKALAGAGAAAVVALGLLTPQGAQAAPNPAAATAAIEATPAAMPTTKVPTAVGKPMAGQKLGTKVTKGAPIDPSKVSAQSLTSCTSNCYKYNTGLQNVTSTLGVSANVMISWPFSDTCTHDPGAHSIAELAALKSRAGGGRDIVEIGWRSDYCTYGNDEPHMFIFYWVNGSPAPGGYNSGYTPYAPGPTVSTVQPGDAVGSLTGSAKQMGVQYVSGVWAFSFDNKWMGYIPADPAGGSLATNKWYGSGANYTSATQIQAFGEVWSTYNEPCTDMENGRWGTISPHSSPYDYYSDAAYFSNVTPLGNTPSLTLSKTPSTEVNYEPQFLSGSVKSFFLGGGGYTSTGGNGGPGGSC